MGSEEYGHRQSIPDEIQRCWRRCDMDCIPCFQWMALENLELSASSQIFVAFRCSNSGAIFEERINWIGDRKMIMGYWRSIFSCALGYYEKIDPTVISRHDLTDCGSNLKTADRAKLTEPFLHVDPDRPLQNWNLEKAQIPVHLWTGPKMSSDDPKLRWLRFCLNLFRETWPPRKQIFCN